MSQKTAITITSLSKIYKLYGSRNDRIKEVFHPFKKTYHKQHHALKDINLTIEKGEVVGIIGKNGSGKSTFLKILASVVTPTTGSFECKGKVTALLDLSGGFNPDLTGIENIYFLGAIQGFSKIEMKKRIPEIIDFADIGEYINQSVKTYSSGMHVRLAFSIAININPEILLTDEVLAVGDLRFQKKCYRKIREFKELGKTIVICTHSLGLVKDFCTCAIWINDGIIEMKGDPNYVTEAYLAYMNSKKSVSSSINNSNNEVSSVSNTISGLSEELQLINWFNPSGCDSFGTHDVEIKLVSLINANTNKSISEVKNGDRLRVVMVIIANSNIDNPGIQLLVKNTFGTTVFKINSYKTQQPIHFNQNKPTTFFIDFIFPNIVRGGYSISLVALNMNNNSFEYLHWIHDVLLFNVVTSDVRYHEDSILVIEDAIIQTIN
ncbi:MAG: ABC transporter ATP-binding protein [Melioribacteraceae bacterium]